MKSGGMLEGVEGGEVNIDSALALIEELELLPPSELTLHTEEIREKITALREEQANGIDTPGIREAITKLTRLKETAGRN